MGFSLKGWVGIALSIIAAIFMLISGTSYMTTSGFRETMKWVGHSHEVLENIEKMMFQLTNLETGQRGYLLVANESYLDPYYRGLHKKDLRSVLKKWIKPILIEKRS